LLNQVSTTSQSLAEGSSEQAASIEETSSSLEELSSMTKRNADNSQKANDLSRQTRTAADKGVADMQEMNNAMAAIKASSDDTPRSLKPLMRLHFKRTFSRSTPPSKPRGPEKPAWASP
jgi:methyl-accepting chemotaxis protein